VTGAALAPGVADAGSITYTWHEDDGQNVTGQLIVSDLALFAGQITQTDVIAFAFDTPRSFFTQAKLFPPTIPIDMTTGAPRASNTSVTSSPSSFSVALDSSYQQISGETWSYFQSDPLHFGNGSGHWTITISSVPEPSSAALAAIGAVVAYGWSRRRRA
jgi:hypothetical protein